MRLDECTFFGYEMQRLIDYCNDRGHRLVIDVSKGAEVLDRDGGVVLRYDFGGESLRHRHLLSMFEYLMQYEHQPRRPRY